MPLPPRLPKGKASHKLEVRVPRYLWHQFLEACKAEGYGSASAALRVSMQMFIRTVRKREVLLGGKSPKRRGR